jgi:hypothetical protein
MRKTVRIRIIILLCLWPAVQSFGQIDTLNQSKDETGYRIKGKYRDRTMAMYINGKGSIMDVGHGMAFRYGIGTATEFKLYNNHSLGAGLGLFYTMDRPLFSDYDKRNVNLEFEIGYRYYHNLRNRMSKGLTGNNFSANYFLFSPYFSLQYRPYRMKGYSWDFNKGIWVIQYTSAIEFNPGLRLGYGLQRTFWRNMNFDINGGIQFRRWTFLRSPADLIYIQFSLGYIFK